MQLMQLILPLFGLNLSLPPHFYITLSTPCLVHTNSILNSQLIEPGMDKVWKRYYFEPEFNPGDGW